MAGFLQSISDFWHNATTGELSDAQKQDIAVASTQEYTPCASGNSVLPECQDMTNANLHDINTILPDSGCVLNIPGMGCFKSWNTVAFTVVGVILLIVLLPTLISSFAVSRSYR